MSVRTVVGRLRTQTRPGYQIGHPQVGISRLVTAAGPLIAMVSESSSNGKLFQDCRARKLQVLRHFRDCRVLGNAGDVEKHPLKPLQYHRMRDIKEALVLLYLALFFSLQCLVLYST
ncbi:MAG: hypothetical protein FE78DRAFT_445189 [Acidomyces sp. 'richmondensis']|nr:MAG: hypothetical protein FE78DRAFT_445189 [Acidomyces sp. 'richmondensis']